MNKKYMLIAGVLIVVGGVAYYGLSPLWNNIYLDEAVPEPTYGMGLGEPPTVAETVGVPVVATTAHPASGRVRVVVADDTRYLRYENFKTINGPDLYVYLAKDLDAKEFVSLGLIKATEGNVNYEIPQGVDLGEYRYALVWCKAFGVLFNSADLAAAL